MVRLTQTAKLPRLRRCWGHWVGVVEMFATRSLGLRTVDSVSYKALYGELLEICRHLEANGDEVDKEHVRQLQEIVRPWLSVQALARADRLVVFSVLTSGWSAGEKIGCNHKPSRLLRWTGLVVLSVCVAVVSILSMTRVAKDFVHDGVQSLLIRASQCWSLIGSLGDDLKAVLVGLLVIVVSLFLVGRTRGGG